MKAKAVSYKKEAHVAVLRFAETPDKQAPILSLAHGLWDICGEINSDREVRVAALFGVENLEFSLDAKHMEEYLLPGQTGEIGFCSVAGPIAALEVPVLVGSDGDLNGQGLELALAGDLRICSAGSRFGLLHVAAGMLPWDGGGQRLARIAGAAKAMEMILTAEAIDASEALRIGIVSRIVSSGDIRPVVMDTAFKMAAQGPVALKYAKEAVLKGMDMTLEQGLRLEADLYALLQTTRDRTEGIRAFQQKLAPKFKGE